LIARKGELEKAAQLVDRVRLSNKASDVMYNPLITGLLARGFGRKAGALQLEMENEGIVALLVVGV
jgi:hypothetical protein